MKNLMKALVAVCAMSMASGVSAGKITESGDYNVDWEWTLNVVSSVTTEASEPTTTALLTLGLLGLGIAARRRRLL